MIESRCETFFKIVKSEKSVFVLCLIFKTKYPIDGNYHDDGCLRDFLTKLSSLQRKTTQTVRRMFKTLVQIIILKLNFNACTVLLFESAQTVQIGVQWNIPVFFKVDSGQSEGIAWRRVVVPLWRCCLVVASSGSF